MTPSQAFRRYLIDHHSGGISHATIDTIVEAAAAVFRPNPAPVADLPRFTEEELMGLTALVNGETCERDATNSGRESEGKAMAYDDSVAWPALDALRAELKRRKVLS